MCYGTIKEGRVIDQGIGRRNTTIKMTSTSKVEEQENCKTEERL